jgi:CheY-like chemotaxis protein
MSPENVNLLIVDDDATLRESLTQLFTALGYPVRSAKDGLTALVEFKRGVPHVVLSDLNMPGMSGFEFLSVVRRRFPEVRAVAMSGAYGGEEVPPGIAADTFFEKGSGVRALVDMVSAEVLGRSADVVEDSFEHDGRPSVPAWIAASLQDASGEVYVLLVCPECLRSFKHLTGTETAWLQTVDCASCGCAIQYAIVQPEGPAVPNQFVRNETSASA